MGGQPRKALLAHTADSDEQSVAPLRPQYARQSAQMLDRVGEEYQAHVLGRDHAVVVEVVLQDDLGLVEVDDLFVQPIVFLCAEN